MKNNIHTQEGNQPEMSEAVSSQSIRYNQVERILGDNLILYKGRIWTTQEDIKMFPDTLTLSNPLPTRNFNSMLKQLNHALGGY